MFEDSDRPGGALADDLAALAAVVDRLSAVDVGALDGPTAQVLATALGRASDRLSAVRVCALPQVEADGRWALDGARTFPQWVARRLGGSVAQARRDVRLGRVLRDDLPATARAVTEGRVPLEHARVLATCGATSDVRREVLARPEGCNEEFLVAQAGVLHADQFRTLVRHWAATADPDSDDRGFREAAEREFLELSRTLGGYHLAGFLTDEHGQALTAALSAVAGVPAADDQRSTSQRRAQALADLARLTLDHGLVGAGAAVRPHLSVHVSWETLQGLAGAAVRGGPAVTGTPDDPDPQLADTDGEPEQRVAGPDQEPVGEADPTGPGTPDDAGGEHGASDRSVHPARPAHPAGSTRPARSTRPPEPARPVRPVRPVRPARPGLPAPPWPGGVVARTAAGSVRPDGTSVGVQSATFDDGTPVPPALLARLACDSEISRIVFGPSGVVLDVGRARRTVTGQLRRAVVARDRRCTYPECDAPPAMSEVHHPHHWADGGVTSVENGCLLCWHHHDLVHRLGTTVTWADGGWVFTDRNGRRIGAGVEAVAA